MSETPDPLDDMQDSVVLNPSAIGNPNETPRLFVGAALRALLNPCACGGVNGHHQDDCLERKP